MKHFAKKTLTVVFLLLIVAISGVNLKLAWKVIRAPSKNFPFEKRVEQIKTNYPQNFKWRYEFIDINGLFVALSGIDLLNGVYRKNGMLMTQEDIKNIDKEVEYLCVLNDYLKSKNIPYVYFQVPDKVDREAKIFPTGVKTGAINSGDQILHALTQEGILTYDLRKDIAASPEDVYKHFFKTDHHWNVEGAFLAFSKIVEEIGKQLKVEVLSLPPMDRSNWSCHTVENVMFGSAGKRVGRFFSGTEALSYLTPKFPTNLSSSRPIYYTYKEGTFENAILRKAVIEKEFISQQSIYKSDAYAVFGSCSTVTSFRNRKPYIKKRVLLLTDSFGEAMSGFFATLFEEVDMINLRWYSRCTTASLANDIERFQPDIVVHALSSHWINTNDSVMFNSRIVEKTSLTKTDAPPFHKDTVQLVADGKNKWFARRFGGKLKNDATYKFTCSRINVKQGNVQAATMNVYDLVSKKTLDKFTFDIEYGNAKGEFAWVFKVPSHGEWYCALFAGEGGKCENDVVVWEDCCLEEYQYVHTK